MGSVVQTGYSRMFLIEGRAGPSRVPVYEGLWRAGALSRSQGDSTPIYIPDPNAYNKFKIDDNIPGAPANPTLTVNSRYTANLSVLLKMAKLGCEHDLQVHFGACQDPRSFNAGWDKILVLEGARLTDYGTTDLGALEPGQQAATGEDVTFTGLDAYEIKKLTFAEKAAATVLDKIIAITICDLASCGGACGARSDGCARIFAVTDVAGGSPSAIPTVVFSDDAGLTWEISDVTTLGGSDTPTDIFCVGLNLIVLSAVDLALHYAPIADVIANTETWIKITTGFNASGGPNKGWSASPTATWIVGQGGYIYFAEDPTAGVVVQDAGSATAQNLLDVHGIDDLNVIAVGVSNAVVHTTSGGSTWSSVTGPAVGVTLNCCWMLTTTEWLVGAANGKLYYTTDSGLTWVERTFPGSGTGAVTRLSFSNRSVGYMTHNTTAPLGRVLRTISGGNTWYVLPESVGTIPDNDGLFALVACPNDANTVYAGGEIVTNGDGIIIGSA